MKLYYYPGASSLAPHIALREASRAFGFERVDLKGNRTASGAEYSEINPKREVPALQLDEAGGEILTEPPAILTYIADLAPDLHLAPPSGTFARYHLEEWLSFIYGELDKSYEWLFEPDTPAHTQERARARLAERFEYLNAIIVNRAHVMGETFTVADAYLFVMERWCERFDIDRLLWPNVDAHYMRVLQRPAVQAALGAEGLLEHKRARRSA
jgi:glutathione S-transferase